MIEKLREQIEDVIRMIKNRIWQQLGPEVLREVEEELERDDGSTPDEG